MYAPLHADSGLTLSGSLTITPRLGADAMDLLNAIAPASLRASLDQKPSALVDTLAPGHPDGPNPWVSCPDGCCLDISEDAYVRVDAIEPWLAYVVGTLFVDHSFTGALVFWDHADRTFSALVVEGTRVRRQAVLRRTPGRSSRTGRDDARDRLRAV